jgi:hypothetical protein
MTDRIILCTFASGIYVGGVPPKSEQHSLNRIPHDSRRGIWLFAQILPVSR